MLFSSVNGQVSQQIAINDRAVNYGDGLFTTALIEQGQVVLWPAHLNRLQTGCTQLAISGVDFSWLSQYVTELAKNYYRAVLKVLISAGAGGRGYSRLGVDKATVVVTIFDYPTQYLTWQKNGIHLGIANTKLGLNPALAGIKHLNRLEQVLVRNELDQRPEDDLVVLNIQEQVIETSSANLFYYQDGWYTPDLSLSGVDGLLRQHILATLPNIKIKTTSFADLAQAQAMFICNSVANIVPVARFQDNTLSLSLVKELQDLLAC